MRLVIALGGNAMTAPDGTARPDDQRAAVRTAMAAVADLVVAGHDVVLTHGNGPQVGNLLLKNELAADTVPPVPLDWCVAQTQATIGMLIVNALDDALRARGVNRFVATVVTRTLVDADDPALGEPTKPIGRYASQAEAQTMVAHGQQWVDRGPQGWRRVVASPEPLEILDLPSVHALLDAGLVAVCCGGGGIPTVRTDHGYAGVEAVIDKDLTAVLLAQAVRADALVIATDVEAAVLGWGTPAARPIAEVTTRELRALAAAGSFGAGSMGPKVEAVVRFAERTGRRGIITSLLSIAAAVAGRAGTRVVPDATNPEDEPDRVSLEGHRDA